MLTSQINKETQRKISYIRTHIEKHFPKRRLVIHEQSIGQFHVYVERDDFGHWSTDAGLGVHDEKGLDAVLGAYTLFYDSILPSRKDVKDAIYGSKS